MGTGQRLPRPLRTLDKGRREVRTWGQARGSADSRDHSPPCRAGWAHGCTCPSFLPPRHGGWRRPLLPVGNERLCRRHSPAVASPPPPTQGWPRPAGSVGCTVLLECVQAVCSPQRPVKPGRLGPSREPRGSHGELSFLRQTPAVGSGRRQRGGSWGSSWGAGQPGGPGCVSKPCAAQAFVSLSDPRRRALHLVSGAGDHSSPPCAGPGTAGQLWAPRSHPQHPACGPRACPAPSPQPMSPLHMSLASLGSLCLLL